MSRDMTRRSAFGALLGLLAAPFALRSKAATPPAAKPPGAPLYIKGEIEAVFRHKGDASVAYEAYREAMGRVNAVPMRLTLGPDGFNAACRRTFPAGTLLLAGADASHTTDGKDPVVRVRYAYDGVGLNRTLIPGVGPRDITPAPYAVASFEPFRTLHESLTWTHVRH